MIDRRGSPSRAALIAEALRLFAQPDPKLTTRVIAAQLGITKNALIGIINRAKVARRPSPLRPKRADTSPRRHPNVRTKVSLPPLASIAAAPKPTGPSLCPSRTCAYPLWADRDPPPQPPRYCDAPVLVRRTEAGPQTTAWCPTHYGQVFVTRVVLSRQTQGVGAP